MSDIYYNAEQKEIAVILDYGLCNSLNFNSLRECIFDLRKRFPKLSVAVANNMTFSEVYRRSTRHRNMFYTRFPYDLSQHKEDEHYIAITDTENSEKAYIIRSHVKGVDGWTQEDETAEQVMNRMIHD